MRRLNAVPEEAPQKSDSNFADDLAPKISGPVTFKPKRVVIERKRTEGISLRSSPSTPGFTSLGNMLNKPSFDCTQLRES